MNAMQQRSHKSLTLSDSGKKVTLFLNTKITDTFLINEVKNLKQRTQNEWGQLSGFITTT